MPFDGLREDWEPIQWVSGPRSVAGGWFWMMVGSLLVLLAVAMMVFSTMARADVAPAPWHLGSCHEIQGSIAGAAQNVAWTLNAGQKMWCVQNPGNQSEVIFYRFTGTADTTSGHNGEIAPGQMTCFQGFTIADGTNFNLSVNAVTNTHPYFALECE